MSAASNILKKIFLVLYLLVLAGIGTNLFFGDQLSFLANSLHIFGTQEQVVSRDKLTVVYAFPVQNLNPTLFDSITRSYLVDIYEGLVQTDRNLKIESGLAVSWGLIDPLTWEFRLRPDVQFHNGKSLTPDDVVSSLEYARSDNASQLRDLLNTIDKIEVKGTDRILIHTKVPDPLLLNKLSVTYVFPKNYENFDAPVGTGPYQFDVKDQNTMTLKRFDKYWGKKPAYKQVVLKAITDRDARVEALKKDEVQLLANVPPASGCALKGDDTQKLYKCTPIDDSHVQITSVPSLEVSFLVFNFNNTLFKDKTIRQAFVQAFDPQYFVDSVYGFARPDAQFVSSGVFGFNSGIKSPGYDLEKAKAAMNAALAETFERQNVTFDYPVELDTVGQYVKTQLTALGLDVTLNPLSDTDLQNKITSGQSDFYFLGWRSELGDASDFLQGVAHTQDAVKGYGHFNGAHYSSADVDKLIEDSQQNLDVGKRLLQLQQAMKILVEDDVLGVPLFESDLIFAYSKNIQFEPRLDGYIHVSEIK